MSFSLLFISIIFIFLAYEYSYRRLKYKLPSGPFPWPILGNLPYLEPDIFQCLDKWSQIYGQIISLWLGSTLNVVVSSSELAKEVLKDKDQLLAHRPRNKPVSIMSKDGKGILWADYGPHYVKLRKICTLELFSPKGIEALRPIREGEVRAMVESIFKETINPDNYSKILLLRKYLQPVVSNSVTMLVLGKRFLSRGGVTSELGQEFKATLGNEMKLAGSFFPAEHFWWLNWIFWLRNNTFSRQLARRDRLIRAVIEAYRAEKKNGANAKPHLLDSLLGFQETYGLSEESIKELLWDVTTAGLETSSIVVECAMAQLVKNPRVQFRAQEELDKVIGLNRVMAESDISKLPYLKCIVKEALRLHPPAPLLLPHKANSNIKIGGYDVPKGTHVHVNVRAIGRDPAVWQDPVEFRPERFLEKDVEIKGHDFRLLPFGAGRRMCPAAQLGMNLVTSMLGQLLHNFSWALPEGVLPEEVDLCGISGMASFMQKPLQVVPSVRLPAHLYKNEGLDTQ
ncbi:hypothetical protein P3X46_023272 [Hevea brasiliensis]|uniref:Cytochrome P450 n=1 Tax=Hevea brasiliensis TaxID=3981 RepID=A0ABQ9LAJ9_HEVBR|nr:cytochrome P450 98A2-like [Hevea brasiliensis]KAJ9163623.1 hypothetical protein P3X46_023272 [Hevea brasiliensis]